ncbi:MAG: SDR family oxidoreductase [Candidatus Dormibacteraceae bacterium]
MDLGLEGKRAWVLGASAGLGRAVAKALASEGARLALSSRSEQKLRVVAEEIGGAAVVPLDVAAGKQAIDQACEEVVRKLGGLDILISNHGGPPAGLATEIDDEAFVKGFELVLASAYRLTKAALPHLGQAGGGVIVYLTSSSTKEVVPNLLLSNTMRSGVVGMMKTLSRELAADGIRLLCAAPGRFSTDRVTSLDAFDAQRQGKTPEEIRTDHQAAIPFGRYGDPQEFGDVVAFLCS